MIDTRTVYMKRNDFDCAVTEEDMQQRVESFSNTNNTCAPFRSSFTKKTDEKDTEYSHQWKQLDHHAGYYICWVLHMPTWNTCVNQEKKSPSTQTFYKQEK